MSIISEVKCARCDRKYSGVRSRCPYCGARRIGSGKYSEEGDNSRGKMIIGVLILGVLVVAAAVLLFTQSREDDSNGPVTAIEETESPSGMPDEEDNLSLTNTGPPVLPSPDPIETETETPPPPPPKVESVVILYAKYPIPDNEFSTDVGDKTPLTVRIEPAGVEFDDEIIWESSDKTVFDVVKDVEGTSATVTSIGSGSARMATLTVTVGDIKAECIVRIRAK